MVSLFSRQAKDESVIQPSQIIVGLETDNRELRTNNDRLESELGKSRKHTENLLDVIGDVRSGREADRRDWILQQKELEACVSAKDARIVALQGDLASSLERSVDLLTRLGAAESVIEGHRKRRRARARIAKWCVRLLSLAALVAVTVYVTRLTGR